MRRRPAGGRFCRGRSISSRQATEEESAISGAPKQPDREQGASRWVQAASLSYLGLFFGISVVIGMVFGGWLDKRLHTAPWLRIVGVMLGLATGFNELYRVAKRYQQKLSQEAKRQTNEAKAPALPKAEDKPQKTDAEGRDKGASPSGENDEEKDAADAEEEEARRKKDAWV